MLFVGLAGMHTILPPGQPSPSLDQPRPEPVPIPRSSSPLQPAPLHNPTEPPAGYPDSQHHAYPLSTLPQLNERLVRFTSQAARDNFLSRNNLALTDLIPLPELNAYRILVSDITDTPGTSFYTNHAYQASLTPTDTLYSSHQATYLNQINLPAGWDNQTSNQDLITAVLDTGFGLNHQELSNQWVYNSGESGATSSEGSAPNCTSRSLALNKSCNNLDDDNNGVIDDSLGYDFINNSPNVQAGKTSPASSGVSHGTMTSGIIGAQGNNARGTTGVIWNSKLLPVAVLDDSGNGSTVSVALGINYAVHQGAKIISLSLGGSEPDSILEEQINYALNQGVVIVAAAGNNGCDCLSYPARYGGVISVGSVNSNNVKSGFSNYGNRLDIMAPGTNICSTAWSASNQTSNYACGDGTSFSAPLVSGVVGLLLAQNPSLTPSQVRAALINSAKKLGAMNGANWVSQYGYGLVDTTAALAAISLPSPTGSVVNTHSILLSQPQSGVLAYLSDNLNSTCASVATNALCRVRAIQTTTNQAVELSQNESPDGQTNLYWQAGNKGLSSGQWLIQVYALADGISSMKRQELLTVAP